MAASPMMSRVGKLTIPAMLLLAALVLVALTLVFPRSSELGMLKNWVVVAGSIGLLYLVVRDLFESRGRSHPIRLTLAAVLGAALLFVTLEEMRGVPKEYKWLGGAGGSSVQLVILLAFVAPMALRAMKVRVADVAPPQMLSAARV
jgi:multisubunit Na+/H+ antiporter MnhB subunit